MKTPGNTSAPAATAAIAGRRNGARAGESSIGGRSVCMLVPMLVRDATPDDWPAIWPFLHRIVAAGDTYTWDPAVSEDRARAIWFPDPPGRTFVAVDDDGAVVGSANSHPNQGGPGAHVANASFMVDPDRSGRGVGRAPGGHRVGGGPAPRGPALPVQPRGGGNTP